MRKRSFSIILAAALLFASVPEFRPDASAEGTPSVWAVEEIDAAQRLGVVPYGFSWNYQAHTTREEFCRIVVAAVEYIFGCSAADVLVLKGLTLGAPFSDTSDTAVLQAYALGIVAGAGSGRFNPSEKITREQAASMIDSLASRVCGYVPEPSGLTFYDVESIETYAQIAVARCESMGVMTGSDGLFKPKTPFTHEQSILSIYRVCVLLREERERQLYTPSERLIMEEIRTRIQILDAAATTAYRENPSVSVPYRVGALHEEFLDGGLAYINFARYLAGLPEAEISEDLNRVAQHGAFVIASTNQRGHYPTNSVGLPSDLFELGAEACRSSNLGYGYGSLYEFNRSCMDDSDPSNIDRVGHRRWLLSPSMGSVGMGYVNGMCATYVFDSSGRFTQQDTINWPSAGLFPTSEFSGETAWSVSLGDLYDADAGSVRVTLTRQRDGASWTLSEASPKTGQEFFSFNTVNFGRSGPCVIFRPDLSAYVPGDTYTVSISGLFRSGQPHMLEYSVKFF